VNKGARLYAIKQAISTRPIGNQEDLRREMARRGYPVTQATLSRDLRELGVARESGGSGARYVLRPEAEVRILRPLVGAEVVSLVANESVIVIHTLPGCANTVGEFIDVQNNPAIIGTVAGDNTLLVIPASTKKTQQVLTFLTTVLIEGNA
jgi:transcriptional regulator of arginine metabolism